MRPGRQIPGEGPDLRGRNLGIAAFAIILIIATLAVPLLADASTYHTGLSVEVNAADRLTGNAYIAASGVQFDADAPGDVYIMTMMGTVDGTIEGNLHLLAGRTTVRADTRGSLLIAGGDVSVQGNVGGDLVVVGGNVTIGRASTVVGDVIIAGGKVRIEGTIRGAIYGSALSIQHSGSVSGNMELQTSRLVVDDDARVDGDIRYQSPTDARIAQDADVTGSFQRTNATPWSGIGEGALTPFGSLLKLTWSLLAGVALIAAAPRLANRIADHAAPVLQPAAVGVVSLIAIPVVSLLLIGSVIGIPIGVLLLVLLLIALYLSQVFAGLALGRWLLPRSWRDGSRGFLAFAMTIGVLIIAALRMLPVPFLGPMLTAIVSFWGLGAAIMLLTDATSKRLRERPI